MRLGGSTSSRLTRVASPFNPDALADLHMEVIMKHERRLNVALKMRTILGSRNMRTLVSSLNLSYSSVVSPRWAILEHSAHAVQRLRAFQNHFDMYPWLELYAP